LAEVSYSSNGAQILTRQWEEIELGEKTRLESVLIGDGMEGKFSISAAMERGEKNRYSNIWPFEWNRVKIPHAIQGEDYFNESYIQMEFGNRQYIATQAPVPGTFEDFWKVIWEEGVQVIVCLTAEREGGQVKTSNLELYADSD
jgi:protein-tyrosine phosphatase